MPEQWQPTATVARYPGAYLVEILPAGTICLCRLSTSGRHTSADSELKTRVKQHGETINPCKINKQTNKQKTTHGAHNTCNGSCSRDLTRLVCYRKWMWFCHRLSKKLPNSEVCPAAWIMNCLMASIATSIDVAFPCLLYRLNALYAA